MNKISNAIITTRFRMSRSLLIASLAGMLFSSCVSTGLKSKDRAFLDSLSHSNKISVASYRSNSSIGEPGQQVSPASALMPVAGVLPALLIEAAISPGDQRNKPAATSKLTGVKYRAYLDRSCLTAIETVLSKTTKAQLVPHRPEAASVAQSNGARFASANGLAAAYDLRAVYLNTVGWKKKMRMVVEWTLLSPDGKTRFRAVTSAASAKAYEVFPNPWDPAYEGIFIKLAEDNARQAAALMTQPTP